MLKFWIQKSFSFFSTHCLPSTSPFFNRFINFWMWANTNIEQAAAEKQKQKTPFKIHCRCELHKTINYDSFFFSLLHSEKRSTLHVELIELFTPEGTHIKLHWRSFGAARLCKNDRKKKRVPRARSEENNEKSKAFALLIAVLMQCVYMRKGSAKALNSSADIIKQWHWKSIISAPLRWRLTMLIESHFTAPKNLSPKREFSQFPGTLKTTCV